MRTFVYVDGFNLYYGALRKSPWKWLDLYRLLETILQPHHDLLAINYFTARVSRTPNDPSKPQRQAAYIRALQQFRPEVSVHYGHFLTHAVSAPLANPQGPDRFAKVIKTEEKGSDVNLAVHLLNDAWLDRYDCAVVVTNDSDIAEAMQLVRHQQRKRVGLITPGKSPSSRQLTTHAHFRARIRPGVLAHSQLPDPIPGTNIRKPPSW